MCFERGYSLQLAGELKNLKAEGGSHPEASIGLEAIKKDGELGNQVSAPCLNQDTEKANTGKPEFSGEGSTRFFVHEDA